MENEQKTEKEEVQNNFPLESKKCEEKRAHKKCLVVSNSTEYHFSANTTLKNPDMRREKVELISSILWFWKSICYSMFAFFKEKFHFVCIFSSAIIPFSFNQLITFV